MKQGFPTGEIISKPVRHPVLLPLLSPREERAGERRDLISESTGLFLSPTLSPLVPRGERAPVRTVRQPAVYERKNERRGLMQETLVTNNLKTSEVLSKPAKQPILLPLLHEMEERAGARRCVLIENSPLLNPLPTRSSRGEEEATRSSERDSC